MALQLGQVLCLLKTYSRNENTANARLRVRYLQCINPHFASNQSLFDLQIRFHFEHPYNATNTRSFLPNPASYSTPMGKYPPLTPPKEGNKRCLFLCSNTILLHFQVVVVRLRLAGIFLLQEVG